MIVLKYPFPHGRSGVSDELDVELPVGARFLHFDFQQNVPTIWCLVPDAEEHVERRFRVVGTGHPVSPSLEYLASALGYGGALVLHLFEERNAP